MILVASAYRLWLRRVGASAADERNVYTMHLMGGVSERSAYLARTAADLENRADDAGGGYQVSVHIVSSTLGIGGYIEVVWILGKDGALIGYLNGTEMRRRLLAMESVNQKPNEISRLQVDVRWESRLCRARSPHEGRLKVIALDGFGSRLKNVPSLDDCCRPDLRIIRILDLQGRFGTLNGLPGKTNFSALGATPAESVSSYGKLDFGW